jgi:hypothetical protein
MIEELVKIIDEFPDQVREYIIRECFIQNFSTKKYCGEYDWRSLCTDNWDPTVKRIATNKEFPNFFQTIYHVATIGQFFKYSTIPTISRIRPSNTLNCPFYFPVNIDESTLSTTFHYLFDKFKKGIYVQIKNNTIKVFLPFSNTHYRNDFQVDVDPNYRSLVDIQRKNFYSHQKGNYETAIQEDTSRWYANSCIFRNTIYKNNNQNKLLGIAGKDDEGDKSITNFLELLTRVCYTRELPDVCFFINPRDFPVLKKNLDHPYDSLYKEVPNLKEEYPLDKGYIPIFSQSITDEYADTLFPTDDDITGLLCTKNDFVLNTWRNKWDSKKEIAVFRGSATGCGITEESNQRLGAIRLAKEHPKLLNVELTGLNKKLKLDPELGYVSVINKNFRKGTRLKPGEQAKHKYILHIQGYVAAFRLTKELSYGSLILKVDSPWKTWYSDLLVGYDPLDKSQPRLSRDAHYIRVRSDLSNLIPIINWCKKNDTLCKRIADRGLKFWKDHFSSPDFMLDYVQNKLLDIAKHNIDKSEYSGLVLIPFRAEGSDDQRIIQLEQLEKIIKTKIRIDYRIIEQGDDKLFNRGELLNRGFLENPEYDYYIFHDVDLIPDEDLIRHYHTFPKVPLHLGYRGQRYSQKEGTEPKFIGGILSINKYDFKLVNGFPNDFWGWGGEDDAISRRLSNLGINIEYPPEGRVRDLEDINTPESSRISQKMEKLKDLKNYTKREQLDTDKINWKENGISSFT